MNRFKNTLSLFLASLPLLAGRSYALAGPDPSATKSDQAYDPVSLRPLNYPSDNLFASHSSHSSHSSHASHASHASHYSGSSGGYATPPAQTYTPPPTGAGVSSNSSSTAPRVQADSPVVRQSAPAVNTADKRKLQIMRVQMALTQQNLYHGKVSGTLDAATKKSLKQFQKLKGLPQTGLMTTETLNGLGVMAVQ